MPAIQGGTSRDLQPGPAGSAIGALSALPELLMGIKSDLNNMNQIDASERTCVMLNLTAIALNELIPGGAAACCRCCVKFGSVAGGSGVTRSHYTFHRAEIIEGPCDDKLRAKIFERHERKPWERVASLPGHKFSIGFTEFCDKK
jgi:hypothetical protein